MEECPEPDQVGNERELLEQFLDYLRAVIIRKLEGLAKAEAGRSASPPSDLTISGIVKHLARVEDIWFQNVMLGRELPEPWRTAPADDPDWDIRSAREEEPGELIQLYRDACTRSRTVVASFDSLDALSSLHPHGEQCSLRWILIHMIEETARHAGHADLLREATDGRTGD